MFDREPPTFKPVTLSPDRQARLGQISQTVDQTKSEDYRLPACHSERAAEKIENKENVRSQNIKNKLQTFKR